MYQINPEKDLFVKFLITLENALKGYGEGYVITGDYDQTLKLMRIYQRLEDLKNGS